MIDSTRRVITYEIETLSFDFSNDEGDIIITSQSFHAQCNITHMEHLDELTITSLRALINNRTKKRQIHVIIDYINICRKTLGR